MKKKMIAGFGAALMAGGIALAAPAAAQSGHPPPPPNNPGNSFAQALAEFNAPVKADLARLEALAHGGVHHQR
jgi:hypothetical protein